MIRLEGITKSYVTDVRVVEQLSLRIETGEFMVLVGPSGCGKSTILAMVAGLVKATEGRIYIDDEDVTDKPPQARDIAMVFQDYALYPHMSVRDNLEFGLRAHRVPRAEIRRRVDAVAEMLGIRQLLDSKPRVLSGGERQRVAMGRAIVREPRAFLLDEPLSNLDAKLRAQLRTEIADLRDSLRTTTVYVTHDQVEAMTLGHRVAVLNGGVLQQLDTGQNLYAHPANLFVATFMGSPPMNCAIATIGEGKVFFAGFETPLPRSVTAARFGRKVIAGLRPEAFVTEGEADPTWPKRTVVVTGIEELGFERIVQFSTGGMIKVQRPTGGANEPSTSRTPDRFQARLTGHHEIATGDQVDLFFNPEALYLFDAESEVCIGSPEIRLSAGRV